MFSNKCLINKKRMLKWLSKCQAEKIIPTMYYIILYNSISIKESFELYIQIYIINQSFQWKNNNQLACSQLIAIYLKLILIILNISFHSSSIIIITTKIHSINSYIISPILHFHPKIYYSLRLLREINHLMRNNSNNNNNNNNNNHNNNNNLNKQKIMTQYLHQLINISLMKNLKFMEIEPWMDILKLNYLESISINKRGGFALVWLCEHQG